MKVFPSAGCSALVGGRRRFFKTLLYCWPANTLNILKSVLQRKKAWVSLLFFKPFDFSNLNQLVTVFFW